mgnify:CR=1 FL=1
MPLKPALAAFHPKGPEPRAMRRVACPFCGHGFDISRKAISVRCPHCTRPLQFEDLTLRGRVEGDVSTMGEVELTEPSEMVGRLVCTTFANHGRYEGSATVYGSIHLAPDSLTTGELTSRALRVDRGATLRGKLTIHPRPKVSAVTRAVASRALKRVSRRLSPDRRPAFASAR